MLVRAMLIVCLLPLAAVAQGTATSDPRTGCRVVNAHPQPNESIAWSGGCVNGFAQGHGILQWFENSRPTERYEGDMRAGQMDGQDALFHADLLEFKPLRFVHGGLAEPLAWSSPTTFDTLACREGNRMFLFPHRF